MSETAANGLPLPAKEEISLPWQGIVLFIGCVVFAVWNGWSSWHATRDGAGLYTVLLMTGSLVFFLAGAMIAFQSKPDGGPPPLALIGVALTLELAKAYLLYRFPKPDFWGPFPQGATLSVWSLAAAAATSAITLALAAFVADGLDKERVDRWFWIGRKCLTPLVPVVTWLRARRVSALCCAFASFLLAACFLTFAVAFNDHQEPKGSLYSAVPKTVGQTPSDPDVIRFYFDERSADLDDVVDMSNSDAELCEKRDPDQMAGAVKRHCDDNQVRWDDQKQKMVGRNLLALCTAKNWMDDDTEQSSRLLIVGHANPRKYTNTATDDVNYLTNGALGRGRAEYVYVLLNQMANKVGGDAGANLRARLSYSVVGGTHSLPRLMPEPVSGLENVPCVEVARQPYYDNALPVRPKLDLLDYSYFMIYTITTTGYGDLMPITPRTKFAVTLANLIEILYVPIIFILIVMKRD